VFEVPVTLAVKSCWPEIGTEALVGLMLIPTAAAPTIVTLAEADLVGSATLVATTLTLAGEAAMEGAKKTADDPLVEIVPQDEPLQPAPLTLQLRAMFEVPVTLALKSCVPTVGTEALVGLMLSNTATATATVTLAEADLVGSATLVAFTVMIAGDDKLAGAKYCPLVEIVPHAAPVQPEPLTDHVTAIFEVPDTFPANC
jgi:hypothetical protein